MSDYMRGAADALLEGRASSAESAARSAQYDVERLEDRLREAQSRHASQVRGWEVFADAVGGVRDGYRALLEGFVQASKSLMTENERNALFRDGILQARKNLEAMPDGYRSHAIKSWLNPSMRPWNSYYCLVQIEDPGERPLPPEPLPALIEIPCKKFLFFSGFEYSIGQHVYKNKKIANEAYDAMSREYEESMLMWKNRCEKYDDHLISYKEQQSNAAALGLLME